MVNPQKLVGDSATPRRIIIRLLWRRWHGQFGSTNVGGHVNCVCEHEWAHVTPTRLRCKQTTGGALFCKVTIYMFFRGCWVVLFVASVVLVLSSSDQVFLIVRDTLRQTARHTRRQTRTQTHTHTHTHTQTLEQNQQALRTQPNKYELLIPLLCYIGIYTYIALTPGSMFYYL